MCLEVREVNIPAILPASSVFPRWLFTNIQVFCLHTVSNQFSWLGITCLIITGMALADVVQEAQEPVNEIYDDNSRGRLDSRLKKIRDKAQQQILDQGIRPDDISSEMYLNMRYQGTETAIMVREPLNGDFKTEFQKTHLREFAFIFPEEKPIFVDDVRVRSIVASGRNESDGQKLCEELRTTAFTSSASMETAERMVRTNNSRPEWTSPLMRNRRKLIFKAADSSKHPCLGCRISPRHSGSLDQPSSSTILKRWLSTLAQRLGSCNRTSLLISKKPQWLPKIQA